MSKSPFLTSLAAYMLARNYSRRTVDAYCYWTKHFILFCGRQHPRDPGPAEVERYLSWLAVERGVSPGTQSLALNALVFVKKRFLEQPFEFPLGWQYLFPASRLGIDPVSGLIRRHHHDEGNLNKWLKQAARRAGIAKEVSCHGRAGCTQPLFSPLSAVRMAVLLNPDSAPPPPAA